MVSANRIDNRGESSQSSGQNSPKKQGYCSCSISKIYSYLTEISQSVALMVGISPKGPRTLNLTCHYTPPVRQFRKSPDP